MAVRSIVEYPDPILLKDAEPVTGVDPDVRNLIEDLWKTMYNNQGAGLAAPQVGVGLQVAVVAHEGRRYTMINPEVLETEGEERMEEGCLSVPGVFQAVTRPTRVVVEALDENGTKRTIEETGFLARALLHEIDHLKGVLFIDHLSPLKRKLIKKKMERREQA